MDPITILAILSWGLTNVPKAVDLITKHADTGAVPTPEQIAEILGNAETASDKINADWAAS